MTNWIKREIELCDNDAWICRSTVMSAQGDQIGELSSISGCFISRSTFENCGSSPNFFPSKNMHRF
jgi:hypothetical protein